MPRYRIEQFELHTMIYRVEAVDEAEAIANMFSGEAEPANGSLEYIEIPEAYGMPTEKLAPATIERLHELGYPCKDYVAGIRSIKEVHDE